MEKKGDETDHDKESENELLTKSDIVPKDINLDESFLNNNDFFIMSVN